VGRPRYSRQLFFFLLAILLPSAALVVFGVGFLIQERQLAENRAVESRMSFARDIGRMLEERLDEITSEASGLRLDGLDSLRQPAGHGVLWLGTYDGTMFQPAWSFLPKSHPIAWGEKEADLSAAERLEFRDRNPVLAADEYERLSRLASDPRQAAQAGLGAARALKKAGRSERAMVHAAQVLRTASSVQDESRVPFAYYAAELILATEIDSMRNLAVSRLREEASDPRWFMPGRAYMLRDLLVAAAGPDTAATARQRADETHYAVGLQDALPGLVRPGAAERWLRYGDRLVGAGPADPEGGQDFFAVTPDDLAGLVADPGLLAVQFEGKQSGSGLPLRPYFQEAYVTLSPLETPGWIPRGFFALVLVLLVGMTLFGGYLLWRDVQRETRLAQTRAHFVSSVSHEFRTPLTSIRMFAEVMMTGKETPLEHQRYLGVISNESDRLTRMLNNVLSASRIEQGTSAYQPTVGDVRGPVRTAIETMRYTFDQQEVGFDEDFPDAPLVALIDPDAIEQGVLNLLSNALKYGEGSPVSIRVQAGTDDEIDILVRDGGAGIEANDQALIFERFYRTSWAENGRNTGVGLGLPLVKHIAEGHGGRVSVDSAVGAGSTFGIHLPKTS
jgi:signal transduction histidine kinase